MLEQTAHVKPHTHKEEQQQIKRLGTVSGKTTGGGLKPVLIARNLTINSNAAPYYKYMFGPDMGLLPHL